MTYPQADAQLRAELDHILDHALSVAKGSEGSLNPIRERSRQAIMQIIKARDEPREREYAHSRHAYSPYVDTFTFWDECLNTINSKSLRSYTATKEVRWSTDEDGEVMRLEIKDLHRGTLTNPQEGR